jgi:hypothetical protein
MIFLIGQVGEAGRVMEIFLIVQAREGDGGGDGNPSIGSKSEGVKGCDGLRGRWLMENI